MKKIFLLALLATFSFSSVLGCKSKTSIEDLLLLEKKQRLEYALYAVQLGECKPIYNYIVVSHGFSISKISSYGKIWYVHAKAVSKR